MRIIKLSNKYPQIISLIALCGMNCSICMAYLREKNKCPCDNLKHLDKRYRTKYNTSMIENLENIKQLGIRKFIKNENAKWSCSDCGGTICVHKGYCYSCGKKK